MSFDEGTVNSRKVSYDPFFADSFASRSEGFPRTRLVALSVGSGRTTQVKPWKIRVSGRCSACEVGGRWSAESQSFLRQLAKAKVRHEPRAIRASARHAWMRRWSSILACCASRFVALSLVEHRGGLGADGPTPSSSEVVTEDRYSSL